MKIIRFLLIVALLWFPLSVFADPMKDGMHIGISAGFNTFGVGKGQIVTLDWYALNIGSHHLSVHGGVDPAYELDRGKRAVFGSSLFYAFGREDRLLCGFGYGPMGQSQRERESGGIDPTTGEVVIISSSYKERIVYEPALLAGYQRIFASGISFHALLGAYYSDYTVEPSVHEKNSEDIRLYYSFGVGYYF